VKVVVNGRKKVVVPSTPVIGDGVPLIVISRWINATPDTKQCTGSQKESDRVKKE